MEEVKAYKCDHCHKVLQVKGSMANHEKSCWRNPINDHKCFDSCEYLEKIMVETEFGKHPEYKCKVTNMKMYSYKAQYNNRVYKTGKIRMPLECDNFKYNDVIPF
jgi:hypothetical protein